jgi:membrane protein DedA with SNARE-associated domain
MDLIVDYLLNFYGLTPYLIIFGILLVCGLGVPIPEDVTLFAAGLIAYYGVSDLTTMIIVSLVGVMVGDSLIFFLGAKYGRRITRRGIFSKLLPASTLDAVGQKFRERGNSLLFLARFMPGLRAPVFFSAGTLHVPFRTFFFYDGSAALLSVPAIVGAVYYFGDDLDRVVRTIQRLEYSIIGAIVLVAAVLFYKWMSNRRKKRVNQAGSKKPS